MAVASPQALAQKRPPPLAVGLSGGHPGEPQGHSSGLVRVSLVAMVTSPRCDSHPPSAIVKARSTAPGAMAGGLHGDVVVARQAGSQARHALADEEF